MQTVRRALAASQVHITAFVRPIGITPKIDLLTIDGPLYDDPAVSGDELTVTVISGLVLTGVAYSVRDSVQLELDTDAASAAAAVGAGIDAALDALDAFSLMVDVQPDQPGASPAPTVPAGTYEVGAFRLGVLDSLLPPTYLSFARAAAGLNTKLP